MTGEESGCHLRSQATAGRPQGGAARCCVPAFAAFAAQTPGHARTRQEWWALHQENRPGAQHSGPPPSLTQTIGLHLGWATPCLEVSRPKSGFATHQKVKMRIADEPLQWLNLADQTTLECELIARRKWETKAQARLAISTWIEAWYNPRRRHSGLGQMSPNNFEQHHQENRRQPAEKTSTPITTTEPNAPARRQQDGLLSGCFAPAEQACTGDNHPRPHPIGV